MWTISNLTRPALQAILFSVARVAIGWHFFWEGWIKLSQPHWSAEGYLTNSWGPLAPLFQGMAALQIKDTWILNQFFSGAAAKTAWILEIVNVTMPWLLLAAGLGLMLGLFTRTSIVLAMGLLLTFIAAMPSYDVNAALPSVEGWKQYSANLEAAQWAGNHIPGMEGSYFLINKNLVEFITLAALLTLNWKRLYGFDALFEPDQEPLPEIGVETETQPTHV